MSNPVDGVGGSVRLDVLAGRFHDGADDNQTQHAEEALDTTPDVENLGDEEVAYTACDRSDNADYGGQAVLVKVGRDVWVQVALDG